jgi:hypothetical protein
MLDSGDKNFTITYSGIPCADQTGAVDEIKTDPG